MKSENKWSEEDVDELLTTFFRSEVPSRLDGSMPVVTRPVGQTTRVAAAQSNADPKWKVMASVGCAAALMFAVMVSSPGQNDGGADSGGVVVVPPDVEDEPVNVNSTDHDGGDIDAPEQDIEILD